VNPRDGSSALTGVVNEENGEKKGIRIAGKVKKEDEEQMEGSDAVVELEKIKTGPTNRLNELEWND